MEQTWMWMGLDHCAGGATAIESKGTGFIFAPAGNDVEVDVEVPAASVGVLDALAQRAAARMRS
jgi:hypothetical protein